ncbi:MAG: DNA polymerase I [Corynebacterium sp.]|nr:DNA polymerase I [Corynebacterium sp.]
MVDVSSKLLLIDGHSMAFRAFYAVRADRFTTKDGQHTNAVYGFLRMLSKVVNEEKPTHLGIAFDLHGPTFRSDIFPEYKAQRPPVPEEFIGQVELIQNVLRALGIPIYTREGYEADDVLASISVAATEQGMPTSILTGDRDYFQLVNDNVTVLYPIKGVTELGRFDPAGVEAKYGLTPVQYPDFAALRGDPSDNLPGVPGVGEKTAQKWIVTYGSLQGLIEHAEEIKTKAGANFRERIDQVRMNREITEMIRDLDFEPGIDGMIMPEYNEGAVSEVMNALNFGTQIRGVVRSAFSKEGKPEAQPQLETVSSGLPEWLAAAGQKPVSIYVLGDGSPHNGSAKSFALACGEQPIFATTFEDLDVFDTPVFADFISGTHPKHFHDAKSAWHALTGQGFELLKDGSSIAEDVFLAAYLLAPGDRNFDIQSLASAYLDWELPGLPEKKTDTLSPAEEIQVIAGFAQAIDKLAPVLVSKLKEIECERLYREMELPLLPLLAQMEDRGIAVDGDKLAELLKEWEAKVEAELTAARQLVGDPKLNLSSPKQLQTVLFEQLDLPKTKKTKTGYSTAAKELEALAVAHPHPFLDHLMAHREYQKLKSIVEGLVRAIQSDGRIHTTFNQTVTATGRLSSTEPNLQNIPVRTEAGRRIRSCFIVGSGYETLLTADYSQIEMRVMAHGSGDEGLIDAYQRGEDLHNYVGSRVFDVPTDQVTPELRRRVKAMSYGLVYGLSPYGLAAQLDISPGEASQIMDNYFLRFGGVKRYLDAIVDQARTDGYTVTMYGRRRYLPDLNSSNRQLRDAAERAALNAPIQGTAADIIKVAMLKVDAALREAGLKSRLLLQIHDELIVEVSPGEEAEVTALVQSNMDAAATLRVPLEVSSGVGPNWEDAAH